jgi:hypothetical protein
MRRCLIPGAPGWWSIGANAMFLVKVALMSCSEYLSTNPFFAVVALIRLITGT